MSDPIPLSVLALEKGLPPADVLARQYADQIVTDYVGRDCFPRDVAKQILERCRAEIAARQAREAERLAEARRRVNLDHQRLRARHEALAEAGYRPSGNASADLVAMDEMMMERR